MVLRVQIACLTLLIASGTSLAGAQGEDVEAVSSLIGTYLTNDSPTISWTFTAEALWLQRTGGPLVTSTGTMGGNTDQAFAGDLFEPGVRLGLQRFGPDGNVWELSYFGLQQWSEEETVPGDPVSFTKLVHSPNLRFDDTIGGFDSSVGFSYRAQTHNAELNRWWGAQNDAGWSVRWMLGTRYFNFEERLTMTGVDSTFGSESLDAAASNYLIGGQLGARVDYAWDRLSAFALGKAGIYGNHWKNGQHDVVVSSVGFPPPDIDIHNRGTSLAGLLESQVGLRYRITDRIGMRAGYNLYYLPGVALQPMPNGGEPNHTAGLFLHGASVGWEINW